MTLVGATLLLSCSASCAELLPLTGKHADACKAELGPRYRPIPFVACIDGKIKAERALRRAEPKTSEACKSPEGKC